MALAAPSVSIPTSGKMCEMGTRTAARMRAVIATAATMLEEKIH